MKYRANDCRDRFVLCNVVVREAQNFIAKPRSEAGRVGLTFKLTLSIIDNSVLVNPHYCFPTHRIGFSVTGSWKTSFAERFAKSVDPLC